MKKMKARTKGLLCRIASGVVGAGVPVAAVAMQFDFFVERTDTTVSAIGMLAVIVGAVSFKDAVFKFFRSPSALKIWAIAFLFAWITEPIIGQMKIVALLGLAAQGIAIPLDIAAKKFEGDKPDLRALIEEVRKEAGSK